MIRNPPLHALWKLFQDKFDKPGGYRFGYALKQGESSNYYSLSVQCLRTKKARRMKMLLEEPLTSYKETWHKLMLDLGYDPSTKGSQGKS